MKNFLGGKELTQYSITSKMSLSFLAALGGWFLCKAEDVNFNQRLNKYETPKTVLEYYYIEP